MAVVNSPSTFLAVSLNSFGKFGNPLWFAGLGAAGDTLLHPLDAHVTLKALSSGPPALALVFETPVVGVHLSPARLRALLQITKAFVPREGDPTASGEARSAEGGGKGSAEVVVPSEDLRCGLFERTQTAASRPGELFFL